MALFRGRLKRLEFWRRKPDADRGGPPKEPWSEPAKRPPGEPPIIYVTFGSSAFATLLERAESAALRFGLANVRVYTPESAPVRRAAAEHPEIMRHVRGFGYWLWKPYIILDAMEHAEPGDVVLYADADLRLVADPAALFNAAEGEDALLFDNRPGRRQRFWTKRDCFVLMDADRPEHWERLQLTSALQIYRVGPVARRLVEELKSAMTDPRIVTDQPNVCGLPNFNGFVEHRHDQSVLTILAVKARTKTLPGSFFDVAEGHHYPGLPVFFEHWRRPSWRRRAARR